MNRKEIQRIVLVLSAVLLISTKIEAHLHLIATDELSKLDFSDIMEGANPAVVFFVPKGCDSCGRYEKFLDDFSSDAVYSGDVYHATAHKPLWGIPLDAPVVVLADAERKLPYCGPPHHSHLVNAIHQFSAGVRSARLDDANFEHDTQASTGGTTGDWLIIFDAMTDANMKLYDGLALSLRSRGVSLGIVDPHRSTGTAKRFKVSRQSDDQIRILMLHRSQMYQYPGVIKRTDFDHLLKFGVGDFKAYPPSVIPRPRMRFDDLLDWVVDNYVAHEKVYGRGLVFAFGSLVLLSLLCLIGIALVAAFWFIQTYQSNQSTEASSNIPHEAGDDGGKHKSRKRPKTD